MRPDATAAWPRPEPYDLHGTLRFLRLGHRDPTHRRTDAGIVRAVPTPDGPATVELIGQPDRLVGRAWGPGAPTALDEAHALLGLHDDPGNFAPEHLVVRRLVARHPGLHLPRLGTALEALLPAICQQLVTWPEATATHRRIVEALGEPAPGPHGLTLPPTAEALRRAPRWLLERTGLGAKRARAVQATAHHARRLEEAWQAGVDEARRVWPAVPGIGPWTVEHALGLYLGVPDALPLGDFHLPHTVAWALAREERADDARMLALMEPFRPHRFRLVRLLWHAGVHAPRRGPKRPLR